MIVVLPICARDVSLAERQLEWCIRLDQKSDAEVLVSTEAGTDFARVLDLATRYFRLVHSYTYDRYSGGQPWPEPQNHAWQSTARYIAQHVQKPWLWWEADATPLKPRWITALASEYYSAGKPFMGHIHPKMGHMNGVAVYPANVLNHTQDALLCRRVAWDVMLWKDIARKTHAANHLIAHHPRFTGVQLSFKDKAAADKLLDKGYVLFHGCNDGSLIELLEGRQPPQTVLRKIVRWFTSADVGAEIDESEAMWQREAQELNEQGYPVLPYADCVKPQPSFMEQTPWPAGLFPLPLDHQQCHFNCALVRGNGRLSLITRRWTRQPVSAPWQSRLIAWDLDEEFYPANPREIRFPRHTGIEQYEDPRVIHQNGRYWISYGIWRMGRRYVAHQSFSAFDHGWQHVQTLNVPYGGNGLFVGGGKSHEKNWIWFHHDGVWHIVYGFQPHVVLRVNSPTTLREFKSWQAPPLPWPYGLIRNGTPPVRVGDEYISFFHSSLAWRGRRKRYYMGAYAFAAKPPFAVTRMTREFLLCGSEADPLLIEAPVVIFPNGALLENGQWLVSFGVNDQACGWVRIPHAELEERLQ